MPYVNIQALAFYDLENLVDNCLPCRLYAKHLLDLKNIVGGCPVSVNLFQLQDVGKIGPCRDYYKLVFSFDGKHLGYPLYALDRYGLYLFLSLVSLVEVVIFASRLKDYRVFIVLY